MKNTRCIIFHVLLVFSVFLCQVCQSADVIKARFTRNESLTFVGKELSNHVIREFSTKYHVTQCAMECFWESRCKSFNFEPLQRQCFLNDVTHTEFPDDFSDSETTTMEYHLREAFSLDPRAVGPCGSHPCQNGGRCLDTKSVSGDRIFICLCQDGWTGSTCGSKENTIQWAGWGPWEPCSTTCGDGTQERHRACRDIDAGVDISVAECYGADMQVRACPYKQCPMWDPWGPWGPCSTYSTCGRGYKERFRNCSNGGVAGQDRYCKGPSRETSVCDGMDCEGPVRLVDGETFGAGTVEMYDSVIGQWLPVCGEGGALDEAANIACKQNGFLGADRVVNVSSAGSNVTQSSSVIVDCSGTEACLQECTKTTVESCDTMATVYCQLRGAWGLWVSWSECSVTCEDGIRTRNRLCDHPPPNNNGVPCGGRDIDFKNCTLSMCPGNGTWLSWGPWTVCSASCDGGVRLRFRECDDQVGPCQGDSVHTDRCNAVPCRVDGYWLPWSDWSACSVTCASGSQYRTRDCNLPLHGGEVCLGDARQDQSCYDRECPVDGYWMSWNPWESCTLTCGNGTRHRDRDCVQPLYGGSACPGAGNETEGCNEFPCPIDGMWDPWTEWGVCSVTCGGGTSLRSRDCVEPLHGGAFCIGAANESRVCEDFPCPIDGVFREWEQWSACTVTCANGTRTRSRTCDGPHHEGTNCTGDWSQTEVCVTDSCPVDGEWKPWSVWDACNVTCGGGGKKRYRDCDGPFFGGRDCEGPEEEWQECGMIECPIDGVFNTWAQWSNCTKYCGGGTQARNRTCIGPFYDGAPCVGDTLENRACNTHPCAVDGYWDLWSNWTQCNVTCGGGVTWRSRVCITPLHGGNDCIGPSMELDRCNDDACPIDGIWEKWSLWEPCSLSCGNGTQSRNRTCDGPFYGGQECEGPAVETQLCNTDYCPIDGVWFEWTNWTACSLTCGRGSMNRTRSCDGPYHGGQPCEGPEFEVGSCNPNSCPVDGVWMFWQSWGGCSQSCGYGTKQRFRMCNGPYNGGRACPGSTNETTKCFASACPVDGIFIEWTTWTDCPVTCGGDVISRNRTCMGPFFGGKECDGDYYEEMNCNTVPCPVDGEWSLWSMWLTCNATCGGGHTRRYRICGGAQHGGSQCPGDSEQWSTCNDHECPVNGLFMPWEAWGECSLTCGGGKRERNRTCDGPFFGGLDCVGNWTEVEECNTNACPVDGYFKPWSEWSDCTTSCGGGLQFRNRSCYGPFHGGQNCSGALDEDTSCNEHPCPIDGVFEDWEPWGECSVSCGGGAQFRQRNCTGPFHGGQNCNGSWSDSQDCHTQPCPIDGEWELWSLWEPCNVTCGGGGQWRNRTCLGPFHGGQSCNGSWDDFRTCNVHPCPVDGIWQPWNTWSNCSVECGGGNQSRDRVCEGPFHGGADCPGNASESRDCNTHHCPVDGVFIDWSSWSVCDVTCGGGIQLRNRSCDGPYYGGLPCNGSYNDSRECNTHNCPIDGVFNDWSPWETCNVTCGGGGQWRNRTCGGPFYGGQPCNGSPVDWRECNMHECPIDGVWDAWSAWEDCSLTCAAGIQWRNRTCTGPFYGGANCTGPWDMSQVCNDFPCPVDGIFNEWTNWDTCTVTCGGGTQDRERTCEGPFHGGQNCTGDYSQTRTCNTQECPIDGYYNNWSEWGVCSTTCGGGIQHRNRTCIGPYYGGQECEGEDSQDQICNENLCPIPGDWMAWSNWTMCSVTCGGGNRTRTRICDMTSYGNLTAPCLGNSEDIEACHTWPCSPYARTCTEYVQRGLVDSVYMELNLADEGFPEELFKIFCDVEDQDGIGVTVIEVQNGNRTSVTGHEAAGEYNLEPIYGLYRPSYELSLSAIARIVDRSVECKQFLLWECKGAVIHNPHSVEAIWTTYFVNRTSYEAGQKQSAASYFPGGIPGSNGCACDIDKSCIWPNVTCNCDANLIDTWLSDGGYVTNKAELPIGAFRAGDTGQENVEEGYMTVGPVICHGELTDSNYDYDTWWY